MTSIPASDSVPASVPGATRFPATILRSVRRPLLVWAYAVPLSIFTAIGFGALLANDWLTGVEKEQARLQADYNGAFEQHEKRMTDLRQLQPTVRRLSATPHEVLVRMNETIEQLRLIPEQLTDKVPTTDLVPLPPMRSPAAGIMLRLRGSPEHLQRFFLIIENEFPQLVAMKSIIEPTEDGLRYSTTYLIAQYDEIAL